MTLQDIYDQLAFGELRDLKIGGSGINSPGEGITKENFIRLLPSIQRGLGVIHTRCPLKEGTVALTLVPGKVSYTIALKQDAPATFQEDLLKIERIYGTLNECKYEIPLDDLDDLNAIRCTSLNSLVVPDDTETAPWLLETTVLDVKYRANHPSISVPIANASPLTTQIYLPVSHLNALLLFVASQMMNPVGMTPGAMHEGNNYAMKFEREMVVLQDLGMRLDADSRNTRLSDNGWS